MNSSPPSQTTTSSSDASASPLEDRLHALTQSPDPALPEIQGVQLIRDGPDAGLYKISVRGPDGAWISLGRSNGLEKASEIYDMVALGLHGRDCAFNFSPSRYHVEAYLNVLLTFQKLFPGAQFWNAVRRGLDAGVYVDAESLCTHPILNTFFALTRRPARPQAKWPPFCPPWMLKTQTTDPPFDASAVVDGSETASSVDDKRRRARRVYHVPRNGVVTHQVLHAFVPPKPVLSEDSDSLRRTRRGRSVKQPVRYREDSNMYFSDSDSPAPRLDAPRMSWGGMQSANVSAIPVKTPSWKRSVSDANLVTSLAPVFQTPLQCYTPLKRSLQHLT